MALFPLGAVLMPHARLRLRLFEPRYLRLVRDCLREQKLFGVVRIRRGSETLREPHDRLRPPDLEALGVTAQIVDWDAVPGAEGQLQIVVEGGLKFHHNGAHFARNMIVTAAADYLPAEQQGAEHSELAQLRALLSSLPKPRLATPATDSPQPVPALQLGYQLAQYLPLPEAERYRLLELDCTAARLAAIKRLLLDAGAIS